MYIDRSAHVHLVLLGSLLLSNAARALEATVDLRNRTEYTDNTTLSDTELIGEWINTPSIALHVDQESRALDLRADYDFERRIYELDIFEDTNALRGTAEAVWHALPERLDFTARNVVTESTINSREPNTEANRQSVSYSEVGPTLRLRPQRNSEVQIEYLYTDVNDEETDTDSTRHNGNARYIVEQSRTRSITVEASHQDVDFVNPVAPDLKTWIGSIIYSYAGSDIEYSLMGGYNQTRRTLGREDVNGPIFAGTLGWDATANRTMTLEATHSIRDQSSMLLSGDGGFGDEVDEDTDLNEVFKETRLDIELTQRVGANEFEVSALGVREDYQDVPRDNDYVAMRVGYARNISRRTTLSAIFEGGRREYPEANNSWDEMRATMEITRIVSRRFSVTLQAFRQKRSSDDDLDSYDEWVGALMLSYRLVGPPVVSL